MPITVRAGTSNDGYIAINGTDVAKITPRGIVGPPQGQVRFALNTSSSCLMYPYNGNLLFINGENYPVPDAGVNLAVTGLTDGIVYFVYAYMSGATMTLEASTTVSLKSTTTGVRIKTGDASRTLVGQVRTVSGAFVDGPSILFVSSWYNRRQKSVYASLAANYGVSATSPATIAIAQFLGWANEGIYASTTGAIQAATAGSVTFYGIALNNGTAISTSANYFQAYTNSAFGSFSSSAPLGAVVDGYNYIYGMGWVNSSSTTFLAGCAVGALVWG